MDIVVIVTMDVMANVANVTMSAAKNGALAGTVADLVAGASALADVSAARTVWAATR